MHEKHLVQCLALIQCWDKCELFLLLFFYDQRQVTYTLSSQVLGVNISPSQGCCDNQQGEQMRKPLENQRQDYGMEA